MVRIGSGSGEHDPGTRMSDSGEQDQQPDSDQALIAAGVVIALGLVFCVLMFLVAG